MIESRIADAIGWLLSPQPDSAIMSHEGITICRSGDRFRFTIRPVSIAERPVLVIQVEKPRHRDGKLLNGILVREWDEIKKALRGYCGIYAENNGPKFKIGQLTLDAQVHASLLEANRRYREGCPEHKNSWCYQTGCSWLKDGHAKVVKPEGWT